MPPSIIARMIDISPIANNPSIEKHSVCPTRSYPEEGSIISSFLVVFRSVKSNPLRPSGQMADINHVTSKSRRIKDRIRPPMVLGLNVARGWLLASIMIIPSTHDRRHNEVREGFECVDSDTKQLHNIFRKPPDRIGGFLPNEEFLAHGSRSSIRSEYCLQYRVEKT